MKIAILGTRGIPASYSGFETAAEELAARLAVRGHEVVVYCRPHAVRRRLAAHRGARLVHVPTVRNKYLDTIVHTLLCALHAVAVERPDVALYFIAGNAPVCALTRAAGIPSAINVDGLDSQRAKWPRAAKAYLRFTERAASRLADRAITDSEAVAHDLARRGAPRLQVIPYGVADPGHQGREALARFGLRPGRYVLFVGRLEPENNAHLLVRAFAALPRERTRGLRLAVVGDAPYAPRYIADLHAAADDRVAFCGYVFGRAYWELRRHAYLSCAPTEVGGTHPVVLEALAAGGCVLVSDHPPNLETVADAAPSFALSGGVGALAGALGGLLDDPRLVAAYRARARRRAARYSWEAVTDSYERLLRELSAG